MAESFITASADHQDASFRLVQYSARLVGAFHVGKERAWFYSISNALDASRILTRTFGIVYAVRAALSSHTNVNDAFADLALCGYHPCETAYWVLLVTSSPRAELRRTFGRLSSFFGLLWGVLHGYSVYRKLCETRTRLSALDAGCGDDGSGDALMLDAQLGNLRRLLWKLALDSVLSCHWALDHRTIKLSDWQVGLLGTASALLGLRLQWGVHVAALEAAEAYDAEEGEEGEEVGEWPEEFYDDVDDLEGEYAAQCVDGAAFDPDHHYDVATTTTPVRRRLYRSGDAAAAS